jgi:hypothetical protein
MTVAARLRLFVVLLLALAVVAAGAVSAAAHRAEQPQASVCYWVLATNPYPHWVWFCNSGGGGSW